MAQDYRPGAVMFSPKQPTFMVNILLLLIVIGLAIVILLMLFWFPYHWGGRVIGTDGKVLSGGGGIVVNAACCDRECPPGTPGTPPCEDYCKTVYGNDQTYYNRCIQERCGNTPPTTRTPCEESCYKRYANQPTAYNSCIRQECTQGGTPTQPQTPTTPTGTPMYPQTPTCPEDCREKYANSPTAMKNCIDQCDRQSTATLA